MTDHILYCTPPFHWRFAACAYLLVFDDDHNLLVRASHTRWCLHIGCWFFFLLLFVSTINAINVLCCSIIAEHHNAHRSHTINHWLLYTYEPHDLNNAYGKQEGITLRGSKKAMKQWMNISGQMIQQIAWNQFNYRLLVAFLLFFSSSILPSEIHIPHLTQDTDFLHLFCMNARCSYGPHSPIYSVVLCIWGVQASSLTTSTRTRVRSQVQQSISVYEVISNLEARTMSSRTTTLRCIHITWSVEPESISNRIVCQTKMINCIHNHHFQNCKICKLCVGFIFEICMHS